MNQQVVHPTSWHQLQLHKLLERSVVLQVTATCCISLAQLEPLSHCGAVDPACMIGMRQFLHPTCITPNRCHFSPPPHNAARQIFPCNSTVTLAVESKAPCANYSSQQPTACHQSLCLAALTTCTCLCLPQIPRALKTPRGCASTLLTL